jgi:hypothetical protein
MMLGGRLPFGCRAGRGGLGGFLCRACHARSWLLAAPRQGRAHCGRELHRLLHLGMPIGRNSLRSGWRCCARIQSIEPGQYAGLRAASRTCRERSAWGFSRATSAELAQRAAEPSFTPCQRLLDGIAAQDGALRLIRL